MGNEASQGLSQEQIKRLCNSTKFTEKEIHAWYDKFSADFPEGVISKPAFIAMYTQMFPNGDAEEFSEHIFRAYDADGNGEIDFDEFLQTLSVASKVGSVDEKLKWAFKMYDLDGNGYVSRDEAISMITSIFKMRGDSHKAREKAEEAALQIFIKLDKNMDENLSEVEFIMAAKNSSTIRGLLQGGP